MTFREYTVSDCEEMAELFYQTVHSVNARDYTKEQLDAWATGRVDLQAWNQSFLEHITIVAVENGEIVGFGDIAPDGYLDRLYVHRNYQGKGIASAVCDQLEKAVSADRITTHASITAKPFFENRGYRTVREQQVNRKGILLTNYVMEKDMDRKEEKIQCIFSEQNEQCIKERCPFHKKEKKKAAFICVHNSCRSQIAEALGKHFASDVFESYSAGTETKEQINQDAVRLMKKRYGIDMEETQYSKLINQIPEPDIAISMGCNVECPFIGRPFDEDWGLEDPTGKSDAEFEKIIDEIEANILKLKERLGKDVEECRLVEEQNV